MLFRSVNKMDRPALSPFEIIDQIENEFGYWGRDPAYLEALRGRPGIPELSARGSTKNSASRTSSATLAHPSAFARIHR